MIKMQTVELFVSDQSATINPVELAEFLFLFPAAGRALSCFVPQSYHALIREPTPTELTNYGQLLKRFSPNELDSFFSTAESPVPIKISQISRNSPLEITFIGCAFLITLGVIFSGGKIDIVRGMLRAELPPLGKGLRTLREALGLNDRIKAGFGIRATSIKLDKKEYDALCLQDDESKNKGGFQHFLVDLKSRINKQTRILELNPSDLQRIYRYKSNPKKGGWQSRFKKIFGRHFPE